MFLRLIAFVLILFIIGGCVPNRKFVPLQYQDVNSKNLPKDSVLRSRSLTFTEHRIKPGDQLSVNVETLTPDEFNFIKELNPYFLSRNQSFGQQGMLGYFVDKAGGIKFPVLGHVKLIGLTLQEAEEHMVSVLGPLLKDPVVSIRILNYRFVFSGEINRVVTAPTPRVSLLEGINLAGGFTELSDRENIKIIRQRGDQVDVLYVDLLNESFVSSPNFWLQQNDIIIIPPLRQRTTRQYLAQNVGLVVSLVTLVLSTVNLITR